METSEIYASDIIFNNTVESAGMAMNMARREHDRMRRTADQLVKLARESARVGNRLEKHIHKKLKLGPRNGGADVTLKASCSYETASFAIQIGFFLQETAARIKKEAKRYQDAGPGKYVPSESRKMLRGTGKRRGKRK
jgi:intergrase/recombinase